MTKHAFKFLYLFALFAFAMPAFAQETEEVVVDEVIAQVNDGVITLSRVRREMKGLVDIAVEQGRNREEAQRELEERKGELIANLINEELITQRAKELGLEREVEANINQRFIEIMKQYNLNTLEELHGEMRRQGVEPERLREEWRKQAASEMVIQREVQYKLYWELTSRQLQEYFAKNKDKFKKPETIRLSEIFLGFAGRSEDEVKAKAADLVRQLRAGGDFMALRRQHSDRPDAQSAGEQGEVYPVADLIDSIRDALANVRPGGYSDPISIDDLGLTIIRVEERTAPSDEAFFDENTVRMAYLNERAPETHRKFMGELRQDAYIKLNESYRPLVAPILYADDRRVSATN
jgi:hypothetical protein